MKYYTKKVYNTDIHVFESHPKEGVITVTGETKREKVEDIDHNWYENPVRGYIQVMGINGSFFGWDEKSNPVGHVFVDSGFWKRGLSPNDSFNELIYQNGTLIIDDVPSKEEMERRYPERSWSLGLGHTLTINGKIDIRKAEKFDHAKYPNPRTMIGQKADGTVVFVVTDGRSRSDRGLTAQEQAEFMHTLKCINSINCDGGGSSTMVVEGEMVNDNENRKVANGIFVYAKKGYTLELPEDDTVDLIIDPGHGGKDPGGGSNEYWVEKDRVLDISLYQYKRLRELGVKVALTRDSDITLASGDRIKKIVESGAKHCISNHLNAGGGDGAETIRSIYSKGKMAYEIAECIKKDGQNIRRIFTRTLPGNNKRDYYYLHRETGAVDTTIVEYGFADSKKDDIEQINKYWLYYAEAAVEGYCNVVGIKYIPNEYTLIPKDNDELEILQQENIMLIEKVKDYEETIQKIKDLASRML